MGVLIAAGDALRCLAGYAREPKLTGLPGLGSVVAVAGQAGVSQPPNLEPAQGDGGSRLKGDGPPGRHRPKADAQRP